eukprot:1512033-Pyramimonas_sp.AAC.1
MGVVRIVIDGSSAPAECNGIWPWKQRCPPSDLQGPRALARPPEALPRARPCRWVTRRPAFPVAPPCLSRAATRQVAALDCGWRRHAGPHAAAPPDAQPP